MSLLIDNIIVLMEIEESNILVANTYQYSHNEHLAFLEECLQSRACLIYAPEEPVELPNFPAKNGRNLGVFPIFCLEIDGSNRQVYTDFNKFLDAAAEIKLSEKVKEQLNIILNNRSAKNTDAILTPRQKIAYCVKQWSLVNKERKIERCGSVDEQDYQKMSSALDEATKQLIEKAKNELNLPQDVSIE